jgi:hypothetical protein
MTNPYIYPTNISQFFFYYCPNNDIVKERKTTDINNSFSGNNGPSFLSNINQVYFYPYLSVSETIDLFDDKTTAEFNMSLIDKAENMGRLSELLFNEESYNKIIEVIKNPPQPNPKLIKAFQEYGRYI